MKSLRISCQLFLYHTIVATENALLNISAPEGADVFYTTGGSDPKGENELKKTESADPVLEGEWD